MPHRRLLRKQWGNYEKIVRKLWGTMGNYGKTKRKTKRKTMAKL